MAPRSEPRSPATPAKTQAGQPLRRSARLNPRVCAVESHPQPAAPQLLRYEQCLGSREGPHSFCSLVLEDLHTGHKEYLGDTRELIAVLPRSLDPGSRLTLTAQVAPPGQRCLPRAMRASLRWLLPSDGEFQSAPDGQRYYLARQGRRVVLRGDDVKAPLANSRINWVYDSLPSQSHHIAPRQTTPKSKTSRITRKSHAKKPRNNIENNNENQANNSPRNNVKNSNNNQDHNSLPPIKKRNRCDVSWTFEDLPDPLTSSSRMVHRPAVQVNRFSWFNNAKTDKHLDKKRREFRNSRKYPNSSSLFPPQQASLVSQERLQAVVRKVAEGNRFKGKKQQVFVIKEQQTNEHKVVTSLAHSRQKAEGGNQRDFSYKYHKESGTDVFASIYQYKTSMHLVKPSGNQKEQEMKQSHVHQSDVMDDAVKVERGELIARKDHTAPKHSCSYVKEDDYSSVNMNKQFFVQLACMFMVIGNVIKSVTSLNLLNLKRVIGLATLECVGWECCVIAGSLPTVLPYGFGGKRSYAYGSLNSIIYASWIRYFGRYIYNLDFEYATRGSFKLVYSYIRAFDSSRMIWNQATLSSEFATLFCNKLYTLVYLLSEWSFSGIIIYDKYHRQFLFGLTLVCKAILLNQCFLLHSCTNWEELRPLVTSRAYGIKEGFNPCVIQKQFMPWYALVSLSPLSLLSLTILLCYFYYCCFYYYCYYFIVTDLYKTVTSLSLSLSSSLSISLSSALCYCCLYGARVIQPIQSQWPIVPYYC